MYTQSYLPASGAESGEGTWEELWGRTICDPGGQEEDLALLGFPALGGAASLPYLPFPFVLPNGHFFQSGNWLTMQRKPEPLIHSHSVGLWLGAGHHNRYTKRWRSGDCLATQHLPTPKASTKKKRQRAVRAASSFGCSQLRYAHGVAARQQSPV